MQAKGNNRTFTVLLLVFAALLVFSVYEMSYDCGLTSNMQVPSLVSRASAGDGDIWNFGAVLGKGRPNFRSLCAAENGKIEKPDPDALKCVGTRGADVSATFGDNGRAMVFGMMWETRDAGFELLSTLRGSFGREDATEPANGCDSFWWINPDGSGLTYVVGLCPGGSFTMVGAI